MTMIGDRYEVQKRLGAGGMATVYLAWDTQLEREVALKALRPHLMAKPDEVARFRDEARLLARVDSDHVVPIYDSQFTGELCYIVLRRLVGSTLEQAVRTGRRNDATFALRVAADVLSGLIDLHRKNIVHRDI